jgi:hypothetical protein
MIWLGVAQAVQFVVQVPPTFEPRAVIGTARVHLDGVPIGAINFRLVVTPQAARASLAPNRDEAIERTGSSARFYKQAFVSYATADRSEVIKRVQMLARVGIPFFQEVLDLEPGQRWERELYRNIAASDLFLLFWSHAASESKWVLREVEYAITCKGDDEESPPDIVPVVIEGPSFAQPPEVLRDYHFGDPLLFFIR